MKTNQKPLSIYIHIPFCVRKCLYCDFLSAPAGEQEQEQYLRALLEEIGREAAAYEQYEEELSEELQLPILTLLWEMGYLRRQQLQIFMSKSEVFVSGSF